jgi:hypothetical protein
MLILLELLVKEIGQEKKYKASKSEKKEIKLSV